MSDVDVIPEALAGPGPLSSAAIHDQNHERRKASKACSRAFTTLWNRMLALRVHLHIANVFFFYQSPGKEVISTMSFGPELGGKGCADIIAAEAVKLITRAKAAARGCAPPSGSTTAEQQSHYLERLQFAEGKGIITRSQADELVAVFAGKCCGVCLAFVCLLQSHRSKLISRAPLRAGRDPRAAPVHTGQADPPAAPEEADEEVPSDDEAVGAVAGEGVPPTGDESLSADDGPAADLDMAEAASAEEEAPDARAAGMSSRGRQRYHSANVLQNSAHATKRPRPQRHEKSDKIRVTWTAEQVSFTGSVHGGFFAGAPGGVKMPRRIALAGGVAGCAREGQRCSHWLRNICGG